MTVEELIILGKTKVHSTHAKMLLANLLDKNPLELLNYLNNEVSTDIADKYLQQLDKLKTNKPIQYVIGNVNFYGNTFKVTEKTLIPRFETEELVEKTLEYINNLFPNKQLKIIDLGTGTGCIGITLKKKIPQSEVTLVDIDSDTLKVATENALTLKTDVTTIESDFFSNITGKYNVIISNPPYIKTNEEIDPIVKDNEPHLALYAGEEGLDCYIKILSNINNFLLDKYLIAFEIGNTQREPLKELIKKALPEAKVICHQDLQRRDRIMIIHN